MSHQSYLIFELGYACYGIPTSAVQELFFLPDVTPLPEAPAFVVGMINLRGEILPIVDLQQRLGQQSRPYQLTDSIIILEWQAQRVGILVNQVYEVQPIADDQIQSGLVYEQWQAAGFQRFVRGVASLNATLIMLLSPERLMQINETVSFNSSDIETCNNSGGFAEQERANLFTHLSSDAQQILKMRAENLRQVVDSQDAVGTPIAVVGIEEEYFGLSLETVYEFTDIHKITSVPCCPPHILGDMNLRGEIVTVVNISHVINLSSSAHKTRQKAIVVRIDDSAVGIAVDDIFDVLYLTPSQISAVPVAIHSAVDEYLQGVALYQDKMMSIINLSKILTTDVLVVNEEIPV